MRNWRHRDATPSEDSLTGCLLRGNASPRGRDLPLVMPRGEGRQTALGSSNHAVPSESRKDPTHRRAPLAATL